VSSQQIDAEAGRGRWFGLAVLSLGVSVIIVDATVVNVALPTIIRDLGLGTTQAEWINSVYPLVFAALLLTFGRVGDLIGRRRTFLIGLTIFAVASVLAAVAQSGAALIAARLLQGVGGAAILPSTLSSVNALFRGRDRAIAFGVWGSVIGGMAALGPLLGGWLVTDVSWRWIFLINIPIGLLCAVGALRFVPENKDEHAQRGFDLPGVWWSTLGLGFLIFGLIEGQHYGWWSTSEAWSVGAVSVGVGGISPVPFAFLVGSLGLAAFALTEVSRSRAGKPSLIDFSLFRIRRFGLGNATALLVSLGEFGILFVLPLFLQTVLEYSALKTGVVIAALAAGSFVAGPAAAYFAQRYGGRRVVTTGMAFEAVGISAFALSVSASVSEAAIAVILFVYGIGVGLATAQLTSVILIDVPTAQSGQASGLQSTSRQLGSALGIAMLGTVLALGLGSNARAELKGADVAQPAVERTATAFEDSLGTSLIGVRQQPTASAQVTALENAYVDAVRRTGLVAAGFIVLGLLMSLALPPGKPGGEPAS
jgi:EmrB/QacA subfamily drug resistance transporter